jgi:hypothetical protein
LFTRFGDEGFFATVEEAVSRYLRAHDVDGVDREEPR